MKPVTLVGVTATVDKEKDIAPSPIIGALALAGGVVLVFVGARTS